MFEVWITEAFAVTAFIFFMASIMQKTSKQTYYMLCSATIGFAIGILIWSINDITYYIKYINNRFTQTIAKEYLNMAIQKIIPITIIIVTSISTMFIKRKHR